jgi:hypothetical protein
MGKKAEVDNGRRAGVPTDFAAKLRALGWQLQSKVQLFSGIVCQVPDIRVGLAPGDLSLPLSLTQWNFYSSALAILD